MVKHCNRALRGTIHQTCTSSTAYSLTVTIAGLPAYAATCTRRHKLHKLLSRARLARARRPAAEHLGLGCMSAPELACDAGTTGTLSAGVLGRCGELAHLLFSCSAAASQRAQQKSLRLVDPLLLGHVRVFFSEVDGSMTLRERHRTMYLRHAADGLPRHERDNNIDLTLFVRNCQIPATPGWTSPSGC